MIREQAIQPGKLRHDIIPGAPIHPGALVNADFFSRQPLDAAREAIGAVDARQGAKCISSQGPRLALRGEPVVVVRLTVMNQQSAPLALLETVVEIRSDFFAAKVLEQL